jgi:spore coat polysaccharide biosynthesis predicted glycosyltransferase SpsG
VIDGYRFDTVAEVAARLPVALFHDGGPVPDGVALVIAPIAGADHPHVLTGLQYACLRRVFWAVPAHTGGAGVLVTTGAGPEGDALAQAILARLAPPVTVVRGGASNLVAPAHVTLLEAQPSLRDVLLAADVVIATGGQTALEAAACGTPAVLLALDAFQDEQAQRLTRSGAAVTAGSADEATALAQALLQDGDRRAALSAAGRATIDGQGAHRVAAALSRLRGAAA